MLLCLAAFALILCCISIILRTVQVHHASCATCTDVTPYQHSGITIRDL